MTWLSPDDIADRLGISRKTARCLMHQMPHSVISGTARQRIRVSEKDFELWMLKRSSGKVTVSSTAGVCNRKLERR